MLGSVAPQVSPKTFWAVSLNSILGAPGSPEMKCRRRGSLGWSGAGAEFEEAVNIGLRVWTEHPYAHAAYHAAWIHWLPHMVSIRHKSASVGAREMPQPKGSVWGEIGRGGREILPLRSSTVLFFYSFSSLQRGRWRRRNDAAASRGRPPCASCGRTALCASPSAAPRGRCPTRCPARPAPPAPRR